MGTWRGASSEVQTFTKPRGPGGGAVFAVRRMHIVEWVKMELELEKSLKIMTAMFMSHCLIPAQPPPYIHPIVSYLQKQPADISEST